MYENVSDLEVQFFQLTQMFLTGYKLRYYYYLAYFLYTLLAVVTVFTLYIPLAKLLKSIIILLFKLESC